MRAELRLYEMEAIGARQARLSANDVRAYIVDGVTMSDADKTALMSLARNLDFKHMLLRMVKRLLLNRARVCFNTVLISSFFYYFSLHSRANACDYYT